MKQNNALTFLPLFFIFKDYIANGWCHQSRRSLYFCVFVFVSVIRTPPLANKGLADSPIDAADPSLSTSDGLNKCLPTPLSPFYPLFPLFLFDSFLFPSSHPTV